MKSDSTLRRHEKALRQLIDEHPDPAVQRIAQAMETVIRYVRLDTKGWPPLSDEPELLAGFLRKELGLPLNGEPKHE